MDIKKIFDKYCKEDCITFILQGDVMYSYDKKLKDMFPELICDDHVVFHEELEANVYRKLLDNNISINKIRI